MPEQSSIEGSKTSQSDALQLGTGGDPSKESERLVSLKLGSQVDVGEGALSKKEAHSNEMSLPITLDRDEIISPLKEMVVGSHL